MVVFYIILVVGFSIGYFLLLKTYTSLWNGQNSRVYKGFTSFGVSVLIPFRNEARCLPKLLAAIDEQLIDDIEVEFIFIDDNSDDGGAEIIENYGLVVPHKVLTLHEREGKKEALEKGWNASSYEIILQTDADCTFDRNWLKAMVQPFSDNEVLLVSGPVKYLTQAGFLNRLVALDFLGLIAIGSAHINWRRPLICNGANMAYRKSLISDIDLNKEKASGDDVFILQSAYTLNNNGIFFNNNTKAIVTTEPPTGFNTFWNQRIRWASKNSDYSSKINTVILSMVWLYNVLIIISVLSFQPVGVLSALFLCLVKFIAEEQFYSSFLPFFEEKKFRQTLFLGQPFHIFYMGLIPPISQLVKYKWKDRQLK